LITDNPAARLLEILKKGKKIVGNVTSRSAWQKILEMESDDESELYSKLGKVMSLTKETIDILKKYSLGESDSWIHWSTQIHNSFSSYSLNDAWPRFINGIDQHSMSYLHLHSQLIESKILEGTDLNIEKLLEIRKDLQDLIADIISCELSPRIKEFLLRSFKKIVDAIDEHHITGQIAIIDAIDAAFGHFATDENYRAEISSSSIYSKLTDTLSVLANAATIFTGVDTKQISSAVSFLIAKTSS